MSNNEKSYSSEQQLWDAAARGDSAAVRTLALKGVDLNARNEDGFTAYNLATQKGHLNTALTILAARDIAYETKLGFVPSVRREARTDRKSA